MSDNLLPCPFCGHPTILDYCQQPQDDDMHHVVECDRCGANVWRRGTSSEDAWPDVFAAWNRRVSPPPAADDDAGDREAVASALRCRLWIEHESANDDPAIRGTKDAATAVFAALRRRGWRSP